MRKQIHYILTIILTVSFTPVLGQESQVSDTLKTRVIDVVKPYTPNVSDAFKIKETPKIELEETETKKSVKYNIFSFPVASTFTPAKGKAAVLDKVKKEYIYDNYATLGFGSYTTILGEVYLNHKLNRQESIGAYVSHHSSQGGISGVVLNDNFIDSELGLNYSKTTRDLTWDIKGGGSFQLFNWYGIPENQFSTAEINTLNVDHNFYSGYIGSTIAFDDSLFESAELFFRHFTDNNDSKENRVKVKSTIAIPIANQLIRTVFSLDYLKGGFIRNYNSSERINYGNFIAKVTPSYEYVQDALTVNFGAKVTYLNDSETGKNKLFFYPNIAANFKLLDDKVIAFANVTGDLKQNTYHEFSENNPFVSPTLLIKPSDQKYKATVGFKGNLSQVLGYLVNVKYSHTENQAFYINNPITKSTQDYSYGNSFAVIYDTINTLEIGGELSVAVNRNFNLNFKAAFFTYNVSNQPEAWNLPKVKASLFMDYQISKQWFTGVNLFYVGERLDQFLIIDNNADTVPQTITLDSYFDANAHLGYHINNRFSVFAKVNNIASKTYTKWQNYPVQGIQFLGGATYKFDF